LALSPDLFSAQSSEARFSNPEISHAYRRGWRDRQDRCQTYRSLAKGHSVKALSRGGPALDALVAKGAEPFLGSFDTGAGELNKFFEDADAAFLMVKTIWAAEDFHGHYPAVALRFFDALRDSL
jgi:hypothetical protein